MTSPIGGCEVVMWCSKGVLLNSCMNMNSRSVWFHLFGGFFFVFIFIGFVFFLFFFLLLTEDGSVSSLYALYSVAFKFIS